MAVIPGKIDPMTEMLGRMLDVCADDGVYCDKCPVFTPCLKWWDVTVCKELSERELGDYNATIAKFRQAKGELAGVGVLLEQRRLKCGL